MAKRRHNKGLDELNETELSRLRQLNKKLTQAEEWIVSQAEKFLADYHRARNMPVPQPGALHEIKDLGNGIYEDFEIEAYVYCSLRSSHPDFDENSDNIIATLHGDTLLHLRDEPNHNWNERVEALHQLSGTRFCWLFHDLCDHHLYWDWDSILSIGHVWIDVLPHIQREIYWDK